MPEHWPKDGLKRLIELSKTMTMAEVAAILSVSRSAVSGKANRHGISFKKDQSTTEELKLEEHRKKTTRLSLVIMGDVKKVKTPRKGVLLIDAKENDCRWPLLAEKNSYVCCGAPAVAGFPYCNRHKTIAYKPSTYKQPRGELK